MSVYLAERIEKLESLWKTQKLEVNRLIRLRFGPILLPDNLKPVDGKSFLKRSFKIKKYSQIN